MCESSVVTIGHAHSHEPSGSRPLQQRALWIALVANAALMAGELAGGLAFHSLALLADALHLLTDVLALGISIASVRLMDRPATSRHSYGLQRTEVLGAQLNAAILLGVSIWVVYEAVRRIAHPVHVNGAGLLAVASVGLLVNIASARILARASGRSLNMRGAYLHLAADGAGSLGAMAAGVIIVIGDVHEADPAISLGIAALVIWAAYRLLRDTMHVLLEGTPQGMDPQAVVRALASDPDVEDAHHLHLWNIASDVPALSAHVVLRREMTMHEAQEKGEQLKSMLRDRFGIPHATLELECHVCEAVSHDGGH